jgi:hypothetical protein
MNWYYVEQGKQAGPVDDAQLDQMRATGQIQDDTLVWREGMANWQAYREVKGGAIPPAPAPAPPLVGGLKLSAAPAASSGAAPDAVCAECGNMFPKENMIRYGNSWVCASCKPVFMQKLAEGVTNLNSPRGALTEADLMARDYNVDIGESISRGWNTFKGNAGLMIGAAVLVYLALAAVNIVNLLKIPFLSLLIGVFLTGPLTGGLWKLYIRLNRGEAAELGDAFSGFGPRYWQLVMVTLIPTLLTIGMLFIFGLAAALLIPGMIHARHSGDTSSGGLMLIPVGLLIFVIFLVLVYITTCWRFALPLVSDKGLKFWPALQLSRGVVMKHWWGTFGLLLICGLLGIAGVFACFVGVLVTGPVALSAVAAHYDKVFGDLAPSEG